MYTAYIYPFMSLGLAYVSHMYFVIHSILRSTALATIGSTHRSTPQKCYAYAQMDRDNIMGIV